MGISELQETLQLGGVPGLPGPLASNLREEGAQYQILGNAKRPTHTEGQLTLHLLAFGEGIFWGRPSLSYTLGWHLLVLKNPGKDSMSEMALFRQYLSKTLKKVKRNA